MRFLELKAFYTLTELATAAGVDRRTMSRLLKRNGVKFYNKRYVPLIELEIKMAMLWNSITEIDRIRRRIADVA